MRASTAERGQRVVTSDEEHVDEEDLVKKFLDKDFLLETAAAKKLYHDLSSKEPATAEIYPLSLHDALPI